MHVENKTEESSATPRACRYAFRDCSNYPCPNSLRRKLTRVPDPSNAGADKIVLVLLRRCTDKEMLMPKSLLRSPDGK